MARKGERAGVWLTCPCGKDFYRWAKKAARSRCCSKECQYKYARRPSGLSYEIKVKNKSWFEKGVAPIRPFPKGWLGGRRIQPGECFSPATEFKRGQVSHNFKGNKVGYHALHTWVKRNYGPPEKCEHCGSIKNLRWANKTYAYVRDREDWFVLCQRCHSHYDRKHGWGIATQKFPEIRK